MHKRVLTSVMLTSLAVLIALPAAAQIRADVGSLHIRIASEAPPRGRYERRTVRPNRQSVWIKGSWHRQDDQWAWIDGRWDQPATRGARWINATYSREGCSWYSRKNCRYRYVPGHWSYQQVVEGDDYRQWRDQQHSNNGRRR